MDRNRANRNKPAIKRGTRFSDVRRGWVNSSAGRFLIQSFFHRPPWTCGQYTIPWYKKFGVRRVNSLFLKYKNREFTRLTPNSLWYAPGHRGKQCEFYVRVR